MKQFRIPKLIPLEERDTAFLLPKITVPLSISVFPFCTDYFHVKIRWLNALIANDIASICIYIGKEKFSRVHSFECLCNGYIQFICIDRYNNVVKKRVPKSFQFHLML